MKLIKEGIMSKSKLNFGEDDFLMIDGYIKNKKDNVFIWYRILGESTKPIVTLIPGTEGSSIYWSDKLLGALLTNGYRVLIYDPRDTGKSTWVKWPKDFSAGKWTPGESTPYPFEAHYEDLKCLWESLNINKSHIIGVSQGGMIGQIAAINNPNFVNSLCLLSTSPTNQFDKDLDPLTEEFYRPVQKMMVKVGVQASMRWLFFKKYIESATDAFMYLLNAKESERLYINEYFKQIHSWGGYNVRSAQGFAYVNQKSRANDLDKIAAPTLILHGDRDNFFSLKHAETLKNGIRQSELIVIKDGLHAIPVAMYHKFIPNILKLINKTQAE